MTTVDAKLFDLEREADATHTVEWDDPHPWPTLHPLALHGLTGDIVRTIAPHTEADPAALLLTLLAGFGNAVGRSPHMRVGAVRHHANLFAAIVGETAKARKGQSFGEAAQTLTQADAEWFEEAHLSGLSTGEGLVAKLRDRDDEDGGPLQVEKRAFIGEPELARLFVVAGRKDATLSAIVRDAWDGNTLRVLTRKDPLVAKGAHVSLVGHITREELDATLDSLQVANGLANRFLFTCARRARKLPSGGSLAFEKVVELGVRLREALDFARQVSEVRRTPEAEALWAQLYDAFPDERGLAGAIIARGDAQTLRLSLVYALLDCSDVVKVEHLQSAYAAWKYAEDSARYIFGTKIGDSVADRILEELREAYPDAASRNAIRALFSGHMSSSRITTALDHLKSRDLATVEKTMTEGRSAEAWRAVPSRVKSAKSTESPADDPLIALNALNAHLGEGDETEETADALFAYANERIKPIEPIVEPNQERLL